MTEEARRFVADLVWNDRNFMELFTADYGYRERRPGADLRRAGAGQGVRARRRFRPDRSAPGSSGRRCSWRSRPSPTIRRPTARGLFVREQFLCQHVPDPPAGVNTNLPPVTEAKPQTNRDRMSRARHQPELRQLPQPDRSDRLRLREVRRDRRTAREVQARSSAARRGEGEGRRTPPKTVDLDLDTTGYVAGIPNSQFSSPSELGAVLAKSAQCQECVVKQYFRYIAGPHGNAGRPAGDPQGAGRFPEVAVSLQRTDSLVGAFEGISQTQEGLSMSQVITKRVRLSRRRFLEGTHRCRSADCGRAAAAGVDVQLARHGLCGRTPAATREAIESRFVLWFNGNGIPERYWIPSEDGADYRHDAVPVAAGAVPQRHPRAERPRQRGRRAAWATVTPTR